MIDSGLETDGDWDRKVYLDRRQRRELQDIMHFGYLFLLFRKGLTCF
jgi:hypothetical protein